MLCGYEVPVVSVVVIGDMVISEASNEVERHKKPWYHAEFLAIDRACEKLKTKYLDSASIYVNLEPCVLCAEMIRRTKIKEIFFGAYDPRGGAITHNSRLFDRIYTMSPKNISQTCVVPHIIGGIHEQRCSRIMSEFFKKIRK